MSIRLFNTKTKTVDEFAPFRKDRVLMYNCGPTVYNVAHIGNLRPYVVADILRRTLESERYTLKQVVNITDVGHLVGDGDDGEDKMTSALLREGLPLTTQAMREVGERYTKKFLDDLLALGVIPAHAYPKASDHIQEDIDLVALLTAKGHTYRTTDGIYFAISTFPQYAEFAKLDLAGMQAGMRIALGEKKSGADFALWKFNNAVGYDAPFGRGFPGWHIECSAMIKKHLGHPIDIHTGGVDHIPVHHTNEIAQSESAYGSPFVKYWLHTAHMTVDGAKMSKSLGNTYSLLDLHERGVPPLAFRYYLLTAHYRTQINMTWEALAGAQSAFNKLQNFVLEVIPSEGGVPNETLLGELRDAMHDDLNTPMAIATLWKVVKSELPARDKYATLVASDAWLGLGLSDLLPRSLTHLPEGIDALLEKRKEARDRKDFGEADRLRDELRALGYDVTDAPTGQRVKQMTS